MRLASTEVFGISQDVGHRMMTGEYDAKSAYEAFNAQIIDYKNPEAEEVLFTQNTAYSNDFGVHGSQAASSLMNTLRYVNDDQIAIGYASVASTDFCGRLHHAAGKVDYDLQKRDLPRRLHGSGSPPSHGLACEREGGRLKPDSPPQLNARHQRS